MKSILKELDFLVAAELLQCEPAVIKAVCEVEAPKGGFFTDDKPRILFEPFQFGSFTKHKFDGYVIQIDNKNYPLSLKGKWSPQRAMYGPESIQYEKLTAAEKLDPDCAARACSWGKFQLMGNNFKECGFYTLDMFISAMVESELTQLKAFVHFIKHKGLEEALRRKDWPVFAEVYNGPGYALNKYPEKLDAGYKKYAGA